MQRPVLQYASSAASARNAFLVGLVCACIVLTWQFLTVRYNYHGEWSALFCTGAQAQVPPPVAREHPYRFPGVMGWDGQWYHAIAHDPLLRRGTAPYLDSARVRYRRILIPALAHLVAGGNDAHIDTAYRAVILLFFAVGGWWLARLAQAAGKPAVLGLAFLFLPASIVAIDREAIDIGLLCLCAGFALYTRYVENQRALYAVLVLAGLVRETGLLLTAAYCTWLLLKRDIRKCAIFATAALPTLGWYVFVHGGTPSEPGGAIPLPFAGIIHLLVHPLNYADSPWMIVLIRSMDYLAIAGVVLAMVSAFRFLWRRDPGRRSPDPIDLAILLFAILGILFGQPKEWQVLDYGRILSPLLLFVALSGLESPILPALAPLCMVLPRFGLQMASQLVGVLKGLLAGSWSA